MKRNAMMTGLLTVAMISFVAFTGSADQEYVQGEGYWEPGKGQFKFNNNGAYLTPFGQELLDTYSDNFKEIKLEAKPAKGWSVDHWRKSFTTTFSSGAQGDEISNTAGALTYTQKWERTNPVYIAVKFKYLSYNLTYDGNGAGSPVGMQKVAYTNEYLLADAPIAPKGMTFAGWSDVSNQMFEAGQLVSGASFAELDDEHVDGHVVKLTAQWTTNSYTVSFDPNGAGEAPAPRTVRYGEPFGELPSLAWAGHEFQGWFDPADHQVTAETKLTTASDLVLTAKWSLANYVISFVNAGDGAGSFSPQSSFSAEYGSTVTVTAVPDQESSEFKGWTDGVLTAQRSVTVVSNATYEAKIDLKRHMVIFSWELPTGDTTNDIQTVKHGMAATVPVVVELPGYNFKWDTDASVYSHVTRDLTIKGEYTGQRYYLMFAVNGGDGHGQLDHLSSFYEYGTKLTVTATPDADSDFMCWADGDISNPREIVVQAAATYTVVFDLKRFDVTFNWKTGANVETQEVRTVVWGDTVQPEEVPDADTRTGYTFNRWDADFSSVKSNMTVNAVYDANEYTVVYDVTGVDDKLYKPDSQTVRYGDTFDLRVFDKTHKSVDGYDFLVWQHGDVQYDNGAEVSNLTAEAGGVVTMKAVWDVGDLSRSMKCDNLFWRESTEYPGWESGQEAAVREGNQHFSDMLTTVKTNGVLSFDWKVEGVAFDGELYLDGAGNSFGSDQFLSEVVFDQEWHHAEVEISQKPNEYDFPLNIILGLKQESYGFATGYVANVTWTPAGGNPDPKPGDAVKISSAEIVNGLFKLSFMSDAKFYYNLLTNANLLIDSWGVMEYKPGTGTTVTFEPKILPGVPQMFYKIETIRKK